MNEYKVTCRDVMSHICDNLGEDVGSPRCIAIKEHLEKCDSCKSYKDSVLHTIDFYKNYNVTLPKEGEDRLLDFLGLKDE